MTCLHTAMVATALVLTGVPTASAQDLSRYRDYALLSTVESVITAGGGRTRKAMTLHDRPAVIQETEWRAPYSSLSGGTDSVREIAFSFYNDALYQIAVKYNDDRTTGLTNADMIESLSATYGVPVSRTSGRSDGRPFALAETVVLARWENAESSVTLLKDSYSPLFQLLLVSKPLRASALAAIREASRLDTIEAPKRALELRKKDEADAKAALDKARTTNKAVFQP
jgi:hypothetical protein